MKRSGRALAVATVAFAGGMALAFVVSWMWPQRWDVAIVLAFFLVIGFSGVLTLIVDPNWGILAALPSAAVTATGVLLLAQNVALIDAGRRTDVVVTAHEVDREMNMNGPVYNHHYTLRRADGRPLGQEMVHRGDSSGYDGVEKGKTITVLVDPSGRAPVKPADDVDVSAGVGLSVIGGLALSGVLYGCAVSLRRAREPRWRGGRAAAR